MIQNATKAIRTVMTPSMMNTHLQARSPLVPSMLLVIPAVIKPPNAPEIKDPEYKTAVRKPSSFLVYQDDR